MQLFMNEILHSPITWIILTALSEIIGMNKKLKDNSIIEFILHAIMRLKPRG